jgi:hypothetical protein
LSTFSIGWDIHDLPRNESERGTDVINEVKSIYYVTLSERSLRTKGLDIYREMLRRPGLSVQDRLRNAHQHDKLALNLIQVILAWVMDKLVL